MRKNPAFHAYNLYISWVIPAIYGQLAPADSLMREHGAQIRSVAKTLRKKLPTPVRQLYRGLLVEPDQVVDDVVGQQAEVEFVSFSEDRDVACWFADPRSIMSSFMAQQRPDAEGWVMEYRPRKVDILFHHSWRAIPVPGHGSIPLDQAARMHPAVADPAQFAWNLRTQREVIVEPLREGQSVLAYELADCPDTAELDARLTMPQFRS